MDARDLAYYYGRSTARSQVPLGGSVNILKSAAAPQTVRFQLFELRALAAGPWVMRVAAQRVATGAPIAIHRNAALLVEHGFGGVMHGPTQLEVGMGDTVQLPPGNYFRASIAVQTPFDWVGFENRVTYIVAPGTYPEAHPVRTSFATVAGLGTGTYDVPPFARRCRIVRQFTDPSTVVFRGVGGNVIRRVEFFANEMTVRYGNDDWIWLPTECYDIQVGNTNAGAQDLVVEWMLHC